MDCPEERAVPTFLNFVVSVIPVVLQQDSESCRADQAHGEAYDGDLHEKSVVSRLRPSQSTTFLNSDATRTPLIRMIRTMMVSFRIPYALKNIANRDHRHNRIRRGCFIEQDDADRPSSRVRPARVVRTCRWKSTMLVKFRSMSSSPHSFLIRKNCPNENIIMSTIGRVS